MAKAINVKLYEKVVIVIDGERTELKGMSDLWAFLGWDIENDSEASKCSELITRELFCFGNCDLSPLTQNKHTVTVSWER